MRLSIKAKQVAGVTTIVGAAVIALSGLYLSELVRIRLEESQTLAQLVAGAALQRANAVMSLAPATTNPSDALRDDAGVRDALQSYAYAHNLTYAAIVGLDNVAIADSDPDRVGKMLPQAPSLDALIHAGPIAELRAIYEAGGRTVEVRQPWFMGPTEFGSIRVGVSTLLMRADVVEKLTPAVYTIVIAILAAIIVAIVLAQITLRPIHLIRSGLSRLGQGESDVTVELPQEQELAELGASFNTVSAKLSADRTELAGQRETLASVVEHLEEAVALLNPQGELLFANPAMRAVFEPAPSGKRISDFLADGHPYRVAVEATLRERAAQGPTTATLPLREGDGNGDEAPNERLVLTHVIENRQHQLIGVKLVARNLGYLSHVQSTLNYSRKLAALGRLSAGIAHEVKNPLNATTIHVELLKQQLADIRDAAGASSDPSSVSAAMDHLSIIDAELRRLDKVVQGFLRFTRPQDLALEPTSLATLVDDLLPVIKAEAEKHHVDVRVTCPPDLPKINADPGVLQQALLNLALNAIQAMPTGGTLRIEATTTRAGQVELRFEDTGIGIPPEQLGRIFDLYFTTKEGGSGIGLSMVYRAIQLHDGEVEVQSTPGRGTSFRLLFRQW